MVSVRLNLFEVPTLDDFHLLSPCRKEREKRLLFASCYNILIQNYPWCQVSKSPKRYPPRRVNHAITMITPTCALWVLLLADVVVKKVQGFTLKELQRGGGRPPKLADDIQLPQDHVPMDFQSIPTTDDKECRLIICQITDVYSLEHLSSFKTMVDDLRAKNKDASVITMLTGDFLSPYMLSTVDQGQGMMDALAEIPMDYLTWGNHEADIDHSIVCQHVANFPGKWINSNMLDHDAIEHQHEYDIIQLSSKDESNQRKVGLCAVLSDDKELYSHYPAPGAFGGSKITCPWEALTKYQTILEKEKGCDLVIPLHHTAMAEDKKTCREFTFPVILSGHDHEKIDRTINGTRVMKPGMDGVHATVLQVSWPNSTSANPTFQAQFVKCSDWEPDMEMEQKCVDSYCKALLPLRNTELATIPSQFEALSSSGARSEVCTMGIYICSLLKDAINRKEMVDAVLLMGGNIRGNVQEYPEGTFFSLETLKQEVKSNEEVGIVPMPGGLIREGVKHLHSQGFSSGWIQYDEGIVENERGEVTHINGEELDPLRTYRVATKIVDLTYGLCPQWQEYFAQNPHLLPCKESSSINIHTALMHMFASDHLEKLWESSRSPVDMLHRLDRSRKGFAAVDDFWNSLEDLGLSVDKHEMSLASWVHSLADMDGDGKVTLSDLALLHAERGDFEQSASRWELAFEVAFKAYDKVEKQFSESLNQKRAPAGKAHPGGRRII